MAGSISKVITTFALECYKLVLNILGLPQYVLL